MEYNDLIEVAIGARARAYAPYSRFAVGAALRATDGRIFTGCNVENISFGLTLCAERTALVSAVAAGVVHFDAIAIVADTKVPLSPCGACRQALAEFAPNMTVVSANLHNDQEIFLLADLLPRAKTGILDHS